MTKEELIYFLDGIAKNYEGVDRHYYRNEANELINKINSEALKKIPNVIGNEKSKKFCTCEDRFLIIEKIRKVRTCYGCKCEIQNA